MENVAKKRVLPWQIKVGLSLVFALANGIAFYSLGRPILWQLEAYFTLASTLGVCAAMLLVPKKQLALLGQLPYLSPNWITIWGLIIYWAGLILCIQKFYFPGFMLGGIGGVLDVMDGKTAVAMREFGIARSAASKRIGKWLDPLCDKLKYPPTIVLFSGANIIAPYIVILIVISEVFGTLIRNPINLGARMVWVSKKKGLTKSSGIYWIGMRLVRKSKASGFGKIKAAIQSLGLMVCALYFRKWYTDYPSIPNIVYNTALAFGIASIVSRMRTHPGFDKFLDRVGDAGSLFKHGDFDLLPRLLSAFRGLLGRVNA